METTEQWKPIGVAVLEGRYLVSDHGRVKGLRYNRAPRKEPKILKPKRIKSGHALYSLKDANRGHHDFLAGRLVLLTFIGPPPQPGFEASHLDGNCGNDYVGNLLWESHTDNEHRKVGHGTIVFGDNAPWSKLTAATVRTMRQRHAQGESVRTLARETGVSYATAFNAIRGKTWGHVDSIRRDSAQEVSCFTCPQCKSSNTFAISEDLRRCRDCRHVFKPRRYPSYEEVKEAQQTLERRYGRTREGDSNG